ncbi:MULTISPECIES: endonuclease/exonuclease/phosphatase family protein [Oceanotoga]|jgi:endonuclease/exonuclease/phosphatase family metal-dependent hydrolase|uniref:Endonuclease/exonuclease/phosphatase family metal-dependent hydrolase n=1 Tax=Oceanotoga teriensis TaxID=515440 RepID=A0AA45C7S6_9BACT|nr:MULTISPECIES: endonuclease/exonuclease/phosphatase family protein [Oceanotoga]MDN5342494.1 hypothetical protein [Oceanotoga sp.]MDO7977506.1 endonuclease/exonuclease/phosphatase family protein [Oceanotoga teriensis]PWJ95626.1 endonuclease/exonuclease/phosphatase family metal-dependent hydrolase [Oceanotoga teriensis]
MKKILFLISLITLFTISFATPLKVMTYNIRHGLGVDDKLDFQRVIDVIKDQDPDILMIQEVDEGRARSYGLRQAKIISKETGMDYYFYATEGKRDYGIAVLSKFKPIEKFGYDLPQPKWMKAVQRGAASMIIDVNGQEVMIVSLHLGLGGIQEIQTELMEAYEVSKKYNIPTLIAGDFNVEYFNLQTGVIEFMKDFKSVNHTIDKQLNTIPADNPGPQIDFIFYSNDDFKIKDVYTVSSYASDHLPVIAEVELK